tara:strand:- start:2022 stop:2720 length:699 start_codon:yes stop_codon:yes gene_type:complete
MNTIIDINNYKDELKNIILSKKISNESNSKYMIYSTNSNLSNVIIKIPSIRLIYNYSSQLYNQINFPLNPTYSKTKKFTELISSLENIFQELLNRPKLEWITNIKKIKNIKYIKLNYFSSNDIKIITQNSNIIDIKDFEAGAEVELMVHLSHLWVKDNKVGINYDICQIKYTSLKLMLSEAMFSATKIKTISVKEKKISNVEENEEVMKPIFTIPSQEMLKKQISLLKNVNV